jgi:hypothetical protein
VAKKTQRKTTARRQKAGRRKPAAGNRKPASGRRKGAAKSRTATGGKRKQATVKAARSRNAARAAASRSTRKGAAAASRKPSATKKAATRVRGALAGAVAAVATRLPGGAIDGITLLETDHRRLEDLLKRGVETSARAVKDRKALLDTIAAELTIHETMEERVLYPALKKFPEARDIVLEGVQEHHVADLIMKELYDTPVSDEQWGAKFKVFKENIEHHIEEEEGPMFRTARGVMTREQLVDLGEQMARIKQDPSTR